MPPLEGPSAPCRGLRQPPCWSAWPVRSRDQLTTTDHLSENLSNDILGPVGRAEASRRRLQRRATPTPTAATDSVLHSPWQQHGSASTSPAICPPAGRARVCRCAAHPRSIASTIAATGRGCTTLATSSRCAAPGRVARGDAAVQPSFANPQEGGIMHQAGSSREPAAQRAEATGRADLFRCLFRSKPADFRSSDAIPESSGRCRR